MFSPKLSIFICLWLVTLVASNNWCEQQNCNGPHIGCNNNGAWHARCVGQSQVTMTPALRTLILDTHNQLRSRIATGQQPGFASGRRMAQMVWNLDLAFLAQLNTRTCQMQADQCRNTPAFHFAGQSFGARSIPTNFPVPANMTFNIINQWYNQNQFAAQSDINNLTRLFNGPNAIGQFLQMVNERATQIGCAIVNYMDGPNHVGVLVCNYATSNRVGAIVYGSGPIASGCTLGRDPRFIGLCRTDEPIFPNMF